jgi:molecular chaperone HscB
LTDPFQTLGVEPAYELDSSELERRHRELSRALHPDRFAGRPASERRQALSRAIEVNEAFRRLRDPVRRGEALLERLGVRREEGREPRPDASFLMGVMELREALSDVRRRKDLEAQTKASLGARFQARPFDADAVERSLGELRYYRRFLEEAALVEDEI